MSDETAFWDMHPENFSACVAGWTRREVRAGRMREEDAILTPGQQLARDHAAAAAISAFFSSSGINPQSAVRNPH